MGKQMMAIVCTRSGRQGKIYLSADGYQAFLVDDEAINKRIEALCERTGLTVPSDPIEARMTGGICLPYGLITFGDLFTPRQMLCLLTFAAAVREAVGELERAGVERERGKAVGAYLGTANNREAEDSSSLRRWNPNAEKMQGTFGRQALPMVWDFCEINPFGGSAGDWSSLIDLQTNAILGGKEFWIPATVLRGSAMTLPWTGVTGMAGSTGGPPVQFDADITAPPYYDNVDYAKLSDFFYVWLKRTICNLYPEHFATEGTPKKREAVADPVRQGGSKDKARAAYEQMMAKAFAEANRVLKPGGSMVVVYAHKTTRWAGLRSWMPCERPGSP